MADPLCVLYEDDWLLAIDKPAGLLMHPSWIDRSVTDTLAGRAKTYLDGGPVHTVHRLDRPTSGVVLIGKSTAVARHLAEQFARRSVKKTYWALARGFTADAFGCDRALLEEPDAISDRKTQQNKAAQPAQTQFQRLAVAEVGQAVSRYPKARVSLLECRPQTGRKHQIRRHLKSVRHPILGDTRYGDRHHNHWAQQHLAIKSLALRAMEVTLSHPVSGNRLCIRAGLNRDWTQLLYQLGWYSLHASVTTGSASNGAQ
ncbi:pseudouridine synthase [Saccharospirillum impatiens]|uniref:pseudouridine synthase n=1 Tax=Saccharospirillum impatiens TaxID=169438 RepID=UPI0003F64A64|nr:pseudouridine synthase [Saccharospirillum impatiens]